MPPFPEDEPPAWVPLRVHSHYSALTGVDSPAGLIARAGSLGLGALALTDVDTTAGLVEFLQETAKPGARQAVRPILGAEISDPSGAPGRVIALVRDAQGYRSLCKLVSARRLGDDPGCAGARLDGPAGFDLVAGAARFQAGLTLLVDHPRLALALAGRVSAERLFVAISPASLGKAPVAAARPLRPGETRNAHRSPLARGGAPERLAERTAHDLEDPKVPPPARAVPALDLVEAARAAGLATLAVPDVYYALPSGAAHHRVRVAIKHNALVHELPREWLAEEPAHLLSATEMRVLYADLPDAPGPFRRARASAEREARAVPACVARTHLVAEECVYAPELGQVHFPEVELARGETPYSKLAALAFAGASARYRPLVPEVVRRLDRELAAIESLGYAPYFLLVRRIADFARERGIPCVGRGSAADSLVAYCLGLTDADPLRYRLPFERFLNPERRDRPDIDLDFCWRRRDEVLESVYALFGPERTALIATVNRCGLRAAFREAALAEGLPPPEVSRWSKRLPWAFADGGGGASDAGEEESEEDAGVARDLGLRAPERADAPSTPTDGRPPLPPPLRGNAIARALHATPECRDFPWDEPRWERVLFAAAALVGAPRHAGLHPGGVVVAPGAITDFAACHRAAKGVVVTQYDKDAIEAIGLVKMDLLGNRALTVIDDCLAALRAEGQAPDFATLPEDEPATARLLAEGRTLGCFQVESPGMRNLLQQIGARTMDDVIQAVALIRPGPAGSGMKDAFVRRFRGREEPLAPHPRLQALLADTHGVMLYQEDVMQVAAELAGLSLAAADELRRALGRRRPRELAELRARFLAGAEQRDVLRADAARVWELVSNFASFGFCKAHAVTYGRIAWRAVYLKAHHPAQYLAAFLASETGYYDARVYVEEARRLGVPILPPDVNQSGRTFACERGALRVGLGQVKGLSAATLTALLAARAATGPFLSLPDFLARTSAHTDEVERLVQAGAFDTFDRTRPELLWRLFLLRTPERRLPRLLPGEEPLDPALLAACRSVPDAPRARQGAREGWSSHSGLGLGAVELAPGETLSLFPTPAAPTLALPRLPDPDEPTRARLELELLGLTVRTHPVRLFPCANAQDGEDARAGTTPCAEVRQRAGERVALLGWLAASRRVHTSDGRWMRFLTLEDESGLAEVVLFPDVYERDGHRLASGPGPYRVTGTVEDSLGACSLFAERIG